MIHAHQKKLLFLIKGIFDVSVAIFIKNWKYKAFVTFLLALLKFCTDRGTVR